MRRLRKAAECQYGSNDGEGENRGNAHGLLDTGAKHGRADKEFKQAMKKKKKAHTWNFNPKGAAPKISTEPKQKADERYFNPDIFKCWLFPSYADLRKKHGINE